MNTIAFFFVALFCSAHCNPLGQTTLCESAQTYPCGSTAVCESTPNLPYYPCGLPLAGLGTGIYPLPNGVSLPPLPYSGLGQTTVCENFPNLLGGLGGMGPNQLNPLYGLPLGLPYSYPNIRAAIPNLLAPGSVPIPISTGPIATGSSTICESTPNLLGLGSMGLPMALGCRGLGGLGLGLGQAAVPFL